MKVKCSLDARRYPVVANRPWLHQPSDKSSAITCSEPLGAGKQVTGGGVLNGMAINDAWGQSMFVFVFL